MNIFFLRVFNLLVTWITVHGLKLLVIVLIAWLLLKFLNRILDKFIRKAVLRSSYTTAIEERKREDTLIKISHSFFGIVIWVTAIITILSEFSVPVGGLITGAGILGVAVGFGSQSLVKDIITGLFILAENQYRIGDYICVDNYCGTVEDMTLRITKLREINGTIHYVPNGEIKVASNKSKDFSKVDFKIGVGYNTDIDKLERIINEVGIEISEDPKFSSDILESPHFLRVDDFGDSSIVIHISGKVLPKTQYGITGEMRRRLKLIFEEHGIEIPYPTRIVHNV